jgi:hypothetical protein
VLRRLRPVGGRLNFASSLVDQILWATIPEGVYPWAIARASGGALCPAVRPGPLGPSGGAEVRAWGATAVES